MQLINPHEVEQKGKLYFTIGLARSGKSTFAQQWRKNGDVIHSDGVGEYRVIVNDDAIRLALHGKRWLGSAEPIVHGIEPIMVKALLIAGHTVLLDNTHTTEKAISKVFWIDPDAQVFYIDTPVSVCLQRAIDTGQEDLVPVIRRMDNNLLQLCKDHRKYKGFSVYSREDVLRAVEQIRAKVKETWEHSQREV